MGKRTHGGGELRGGGEGGGGGNQAVVGRAALPDAQDEGAATLARHQLPRVQAALAQQRVCPLQVLQDLHHQLHHIGTALMTTHRQSHEMSANLCQSATCPELALLLWHRQLVRTVLPAPLCKRRTTSMPDEQHPAEYKR